MIIEVYDDERNPNISINTLLTDFANYLEDNDVLIDEVSPRNKTIYVADKEGYDFAFAELHSEDFANTKQAGIHVILRMAKGLDYDIPDPVMAAESYKTKSCKPLKEAIANIKQDFDTQAVLTLMGFKLHRPTGAVYAYNPTTKTVITEFDNTVYTFSPVNVVSDNDVVMQDILNALETADFDEIATLGHFTTSEGDKLNFEWKEFATAIETVNYITGDLFLKV